MSEEENNKILELISKFDDFKFSVYNQSVDETQAYYMYIIVNSSLKMGKGNVIIRGCSFSVDVKIGDFNQFNSLSSLAHDVEVGSFNVFMPLTRVSGEVKIGDLNLFGIGTIILQGIKIGNRVRVAPSSVVMRKTKDACFYMGNPAKKTIL